MNKTVLISGASVAGPSLAFWLKRYGFHPTIVEKAGAVRSGGYPIDLRGVAVDVLGRMDLLAQVQAAHIATRRMSCVNRSGGLSARLDLAALSGPGHDLELPRGVLTSLLHEATGDGVEYVFGDSITSLAEGDDGVRVTFQVHPPRTFGLVVGADGSHSNVRGLTFGDEAQFHRYLGFYVAGFSVNNDLGLDREVVMHNRPGRMAALYAVRGQPRLSALLVFSVPEQLDHRLSVDEQLGLVSRAFAGDAWQVPRLLEAMREADDLFFDSVSQIRMPRWTSGRMALVGDAGYAPSFLSGQGTSLAVVGAYQLAVELAEAAGDHRRAFPSYDRSMRDFVERNQRLAIGASGLLIPKTAAGLWLRNRAFGVAPLLRRLNVNLDADLQRAANALTLAAPPSSEVASPARS